MYSSSSEEGFGAGVGVGLLVGTLNMSLIGFVDGGVVDLVEEPPFLPKVNFNFGAVEGCERELSVEGGTSSEAEAADVDVGSRIINFLGGALPSEDGEGREDSGDGGADILFSLVERFEEESLSTILGAALLCDEDCIQSNYVSMNHDHYIPSIKRLTHLAGCPGGVVLGVQSIRCAMLLLLLLLRWSAIQITALSASFLGLLGRRKRL
tara:strand:+ start:136 stop:762 length:627 start_codon:yes stop_codon:yes gene_type:complete